MSTILRDYPPLLTIAQAAEIMSCTTKTVHNMVNKGMIQACYPTGNTRGKRIVRDSLAAHLAKCMA